MGARAGGKVYLVGAGPGAPDLLTVRAVRLLAEADIVFHDALVHPDTLALAPQAKKISVGKRHGKLSAAQRFINKQLVDAARGYRCIVRLKGGDPMLFGRAQEEIDALREAGVEFEIVPGVTAALAASAALGVSLTRRGVSRSVAFVTPRVGAGEGPSRWIEAARGADSVVLYMAAHEAPAIARALIESGREAATPVAIVERASLAEESARFATLASLAADPEAFKGPAVLLVGEVYREALSQARAKAGRELWNDWNESSAATDPTAAPGPARKKTGSASA